MKQFSVIFLIVLTTMVFENKTHAQKTIDSSMTFPMFTASFMVQFPGGDLAKRYGINTNIGGSFMLKLKNGLLWDVNANYIFGSDLRGDADTVFNSITTSSGGLINMYGEYAKVSTYERGYFIGTRLGMVLPIWQANPNSGPLIMIGGGYLQHKIRIENDGNNTPQILGDYKKGYDKMCYGFCASEFIGYVNFSKSQLWNFYIGVELYQGFTKSGRSFDYSLMKKDTEKRVDLLHSLKVGWIIPIYKRMPDKFYYY